MRTMDVVVATDGEVDYVGDGHHRHNWPPMSAGTLAADCCCYCSPAPAPVIWHREFYRTPEIVRKNNGF